MTDELNPIVSALAQALGVCVLRRSAGSRLMRWMIRIEAVT